MLQHHMLDSKPSRRLHFFFACQLRQRRLVHPVQVRLVLLLLLVLPFTAACYGRPP